MFIPILFFSIAMALWLFVVVIAEFLDDVCADEQGGGEEDFYEYE